MSPVPQLDLRALWESAGELMRTLEATRLELRRLRGENGRLHLRIQDLEAARVSAHESRRAALNLMEDAVRSSRLAESLNAEQRASEGRLREADQRKSEFLAMLGHELRNPLAAIHGGLRLLQSPHARAESKESALPIVVQQVAHMARLIDDVLDFTRIERGKLQVRPERVDLANEVERALAMVKAAADAKRCQIRLHLPDTPIEITADSVRLTQVFVNLLNNAVKFSLVGSEVDVQLGREDESAVLRVRDRGAGITAEMLPHIFDAFVQSELSLGLPEGGLGMGLTVSRQLVELHGGTLQAFSEGENQGSEFVVRLPLTGHAKTPI